MTRDEAIEVIKEEDSELLQRLSHDELLEELNEIIKDFDQKYDNSNPYYKALRAVVELHRNVDGACWECQDAIYHEYPCPTIRAIEKELQ